MSGLITGCLDQSQAQTPGQQSIGSVIEGLTLPTLGGGELTDKELKGKVLLVVNVASQCGFTRQYQGLQTLHQTYAGRGFMVIGVPCNQFGGQEPGSPQDILSFTKTKYGVDFPLLKKQDVNGDQRSPLLQRLAGQTAEDGDIRWNFEKFLIGRDGQVIDRYRSGVGPDSRTLVTAIEAALAAPR